MNPQHGQTPLDYLNQIAPQTPKPARFTFSFKWVVVAAILVIILVCILAAVVSSINSSRKQPWQQLSARLTATQAIANDATSKLKNSQIRSLNSDLKLTLTNTQRDITDPLLSLEIDSTKLPTSVTTQENGDAITKRLEDARLNAKFDSTYAREMSYQLATILSLYQELYTSSSQNTKVLLETSYTNLLPTQQGFANFSAANE